jgi:hypothetical protein
MLKGASCGSLSIMPYGGEAKKRDRRRVSSTFDHLIGQSSAGPWLGSPSSFTCANSSEALSVGIVCHEDRRF